MCVCSRVGVVVCVRLPNIQSQVRLIVEFTPCSCARVLLLELYFIAYPVVQISVVIVLPRLSSVYGLLLAFYTLYSAVFRGVCYEAKATGTALARTLRRVRPATGEAGPMRVRGLRRLAVFECEVESVKNR